MPPGAAELCSSLIGRAASRTAAPSVSLSKTKGRPPGGALFFNPVSVGFRGALAIREAEAGRRAVAAEAAEIGGWNAGMAVSAGVGVDQRAAVAGQDFQGVGGESWGISELDGRLHAGHD